MDPAQMEIPNETPADNSQSEATFEVEPAADQERVLSVADDADDDAQAETEDKAPPRATRQERRGQRFADMKRQAEDAKRQADEVRAQLDEQRRQSDELRRLISENLRGRQEQVQAPKEPDGIKQIDDEMEYHLAIASDDKTPAELGRRALARYRQLETEKMRLVARAAIPQQESQQGQLPPQAAAARALLAADYPWIETNQQAEKQAIATYNYLIHVEGRPHGIATEREACARVAARLQLPGQRQNQPVSEERKQRYQGTPSRQGAGRGTNVTLSAQERSFAKMAGISERALAKQIAEDDPSRLHE